MKILQLVSDWKWTGPAAPMLVLMEALRRRGHRVELVCPDPPPGANRSLAEEARRRGLAPIAAIRAERSAWRPGDGARVRRLAQQLEGEAIGGPFDLVHAWHSRDHVLAALALGRWPGRRSPKAVGAARPAPRLVRSWPRAEAIPNRPWNRWLFGPACDGLLCVSEQAAAAQRRIRPAGPLAGTLGGVDLERLAQSLAAPAVAVAPQPVAPRPREVLGVGDDTFLIGVVARMQAHRRFDLLLGAMRRLADRHPQARLVIFGRGTHAEEVVGRPMRALGLADRVILAGHRGDDYAALLAAMDAFAYLAPGSDGSCRALREAASLGLPLVGLRCGAIGEIIRDGETGLLVDADADAGALAAAFARLIEDPVRRRALGAAARRDAQIRFTPERFAAFVEAFYAEVLASAPLPAPTSSR